MIYRNPDVFMGNFTRDMEYDRRITCADEVRCCAQILRDQSNR
jgi:hypothetical protein